MLDNGIPLKSATGSLEIIGNAIIRQMHTTSYVSGHFGIIFNDFVLTLFLHITVENVITIVDRFLSNALQKLYERIQ